MTHSMKPTEMDARSRVSKINAAVRSILVALTLVFTLLGLLRGCANWCRAKENEKKRAEIERAREAARPKMPDYWRAKTIAYPDHWSEWVTVPYGQNFKFYPQGRVRFRTASGIEGFSAPDRDPYLGGNLKEESLIFSFRAEEEDKPVEVYLK